MSDEKRCNCRHGHGHGDRRGPSSFGMHDPEQVFRELRLKAGDVFLDMGCGRGDYAMRAAREVGDSGAVYALDIGKETVDGLTEEAGARGLKNIRAMVANIAGPLPVEDSYVDVCFLATVLHAVNKADYAKIFAEIRRVLKPGGRVAIIECKKEDMPFGPPTHMRLSPEEIEHFLMSFGFEKVNLIDLGYNYMIQFGAK